MAEDTQVAGIDLGDSTVAAAVADGLQRTEDMLFDQLRRGHELPALTSSYLAHAGGKRFRPYTVCVAALVVEAERAASSAPSPQSLPENVIKAATVVEMVHLASLYHDDVMDEADKRRGADSANSRWGNSVAILAGDFLFACASYIMSSLDTDAVRIISETFSELVTGQMLETTNAGGVASVESYLKVIEGKTASLIGTSGLFGARYAGATPQQEEAIERACRAMGMAFQIVDDIIDIASESQQSGKTPGTDLREGVFTLPVLYALEEEGPVGDRLREILTGPLTDDALVEEALRLLRDSQGMQQAKDLVFQYRDSAYQALDTFQPSPAREAMKRLMDFTIARVS